MIGRFYLTLQLLSIDIVIGAVILLRFFCLHFLIEISWEPYVLLASAVWIIYTVDHLRDASSVPQSTRKRYLFHQKHASLLKTCVALVLILNIPLLFFLPFHILIGGSVIAFLSLIYLLIQRQLSAVFLKELYVAFIYTLGLLTLPMILAQTFDLAIFFLLLLATYVNLCLFSWYERDEDQKDLLKSIATELNPKKLEGLLLLMIALGLALSSIYPTKVGAYFFIVFTVYAMLVLKPDWFRQNEYYRIIGDGVFFLPVLFFSCE